VELSFNFLDLSFEELMEAISDELLEILFNLGLEFNSLEDFEQLINLDEEIWDYMRGKTDEIFEEFYYLVQALISESNELESESENDATVEGEVAGDQTLPDSPSETLPETEEQVVVIPDARNSVSQPIESSTNNVEITPSNSTVARTTALRRTGVTTSNNVNFRRGPGSSYNRINQIPVNINVRITGRQGSWYRIVHNGVTGWVTQSSIARTRQVAVVTGHNAPVRNSHSADARILTRATRGTRVVINERTASWAQVTVNGRTGWIRTNQLNINNGRRPARTSGQVNLHARPNSSSAIRRRLPRHQEVMLIQRTTTGWSQVSIRHSAGTQMGWVRNNQIQNRIQTRQTRSNGTISVRTGPGSRFRVSRRIARNSRVTVLSESGNWSHIRFTQNGIRRHGWIQNSRITRIVRLPQASRSTSNTPSPSSPGSPSNNHPSGNRAPAGWPSTTAISQQRAGQIALNATPGRGILIEVDHDWHRGRPAWWAEVRSGNFIHEFYIDVQTGAILQHEIEFND